MGSIRTAIELHDNFTGILYQVIDSVNLGLSAMEDLHGAMDSPIDASAFQGARDSINQATMSVQELIAEMGRVESPEIAPAVSWQSPAVEVFGGSGTDRFQQEVQSANAMLQQLSATQDAIARQAFNTSIFPPEAIQNLNSMAVRIDNIRERIQQIENNPLNMGTDAANIELEMFRGQLAQALQEQQNLNRAMEGMDIHAANEAYLRLNQVIGDTERHIRDNVDEQGRLNREIGEGANEANGLMGAIRGAVAAYATFHTLSNALNLSDQLASTTARLDMMNDGLQTTQELQDMIYLSAERSRGSYQATADAVSKLGLMAGDAFGSSEEIIAFMEQVNKQFRIAGTEAAGIDAAMLQLTQAMGSGVLRGEEFNSIMEQAPNIIQSIADYMDVPKGKLKDMAAEGKITADIVKAAMFAAAKETDAKFASMPMTYSDAWTMMKNAGVNALDEVSDKLNSFLNSDTGSTVINSLIGGFEILSGIASGAIDLMASGATWVVENWDYVYPILIGIGAAFAAAGVAGIISGLSAAVAWSPVTWTIMAVGAAIGRTVFLLQQAGVSWEQMGIVAGVALGEIYTIIYTVIATCWNLFATFAEFFANVFNDPVTAIANLFADLLDTILSIVQTAASAIDALLGTNISGDVAGFRNTVDDFVESKVGENQVKIKRMEATDIGANMLKGAEMGKDFGKKLDNFSLSMDDFTKNFGGGGAGGFGGMGQIAIPDGGNIGKVGSVGSVKNVEGDIRLADEDVKLYRDLAERRYMNEIELKTLAPQISVTLPAGASGNLKPQDVADYIKKILIEQVSSQTAVTHG